MGCIGDFFCYSANKAVGVEQVINDINPSNVNYFVINVQCATQLEKCPMNLSRGHLMFYNETTVEIGCFASDK